MGYPLKWESKFMGSAGRIDSEVTHELLLLPTLDRA